MGLQRKTSLIYGGFMTRSIDTTEYIETVLSLLECQKTDVPVPIKGNSMVPFLREGDTVYLNSLTNEPKRGDVVLFRRADGSFVLHRIAKRLPDKSYLLLGDNQTVREPIKRDQILAITKSAKRKNRLITEKNFIWRFYGSVWLSLFRIRPLIARIANIK